MGKSKLKAPDNNFTTLLIFPPQWTPQNPHYAITGLAGHMRSRGKKIAIRDLNVEFYDDVLTPEYLEIAKQKVILNYNYLYPQVTMQKMIGEFSVEDKLNLMKLEAIEKYLKQDKKIFDTIQDLILDAKETFRDARRFYNPLLLVDAFYTIDRALEIISLPYYPATISFNSFEQPHCLFATHSLFIHSKSPDLNMFYNYFTQKVPGLLSHKPSMIAISINSFSQVLPGLTIAHLLRQQAPAECLISIGGNFFTRVRDTLLKRPEFFEHFAHAVALGEGEKQMVLLADEWEGKKDLSRVPNLIYFDEQTRAVTFSFDDEPAKLDDTGFQDYEGLPLEKYFTPELVACIQSSKGCYWGKCTFCDTDFGIRRDVKTLDRLIGEIKHLQTNYNIRHFEFIDESIHPEYMEKMAQHFIDEDLQIYWFSNGRLEEAFTAELLKHLKASGATLILWGFESGSIRIMKLINKGINLEKRYEILRDSHQAGIWNFAYIFFGFPTETREEAMETIDALCKYKDIIHCYGRSIFSLGKHSILHLDADKYGIFDIKEEGEELSTNISYQSKSGMSDSEIDGIMKECTRTCAVHYDYSLWYYLRYRENIHLYLVKHGKEYVTQFKMQEALPQAPEVW